MIIAGASTMKEKKTIFPPPQKSPKWAQFPQNRFFKMSTKQAIYLEL